MVATDELLAHAAMLRLVCSAAGRWQERLRRIRALESVPAPAWMPGDAGLEIYALTQTIREIEESTREMAAALERAAEGYGLAERQVELLARMSGAGLAFALGYLSPFIAVMAVPALTSGAVGWLLASLVTGAAPGDALGHRGNRITEDPRLLTNPVIVAAVRALAASGDDAVAGALRIPLPLSLALGDDGAGIFGLASSAAGVLALARTAGALRETPVDARRMGGSSRSPPPRGVADLARRIPSATGATPQVRIDRYGGITHPAWVVYVGGTAQWSPVAGTDPWDLTSNVTAVAEQSSGSYRAVEQAMREAGVSPSDPVIGVGHSQGGLIVAQVAASGDFNTVGLATFGAPAGQIPVPDAIPMISTEHADDLVPALGGAPQNNTQEGNRHLVVSREVFAGRELPPGESLPAHSMATYRDTARMIDASPEPRLIQFREVLASTLGTEPGRATYWRATRLG
ncbi:MAG TPA: hypothetical protein VEX88_00495 [Glaciibacter sp.]|nr:hypothetical protein [Glaciibacter sp.]